MPQIKRNLSAIAGTTELHTIKHRRALLYANALGEASLFLKRIKI